MWGHHPAPSTCPAPPPPSPPSVQAKATPSLTHSILTAPGTSVKHAQEFSCHVHWTVIVEDHPSGVHLVYMCMHMHVCVCICMYVFAYMVCVRVHASVCIYMLMTDAGRKKEASKVVQTTRQSNTTHPRQSLSKEKLAASD